MVLRTWDLSDPAPARTAAAFLKTCSFVTQSPSISKEHFREVFAKKEIGGRTDCSSMPPSAMSMVEGTRGIHPLA